MRYARYTPTGLDVAIKIYQKRKLVGLKKNLQREINVLRKIEHVNIIKLITHFSDKKNIYLVMEYGGELSLYKHLRSKKNYRMDE